MDIAINIGADDPHVEFVYPNVDLTDFSVTLTVLNESTGSYKRYTIGRGLRVVVGSDQSTVIWERSVSDTRRFGLSALFDMFAKGPTGRISKLDAGRIEFAGEGKIALSGRVDRVIPGMQGPAFAIPRGVWSPGPYEARSFVTHNGSSWWTGVETSGEPGVSADWQLWLDGSGAAADRAAVATYKVTIEDWYNRIVAAPKTISGTTYTLLPDDLGRVLRFTHANGCALTLPAAIAALPGWFAPLRRIGGPVTWSAEPGSVIKPDNAATAGIAGPWTTVTLSVDSVGVWVVEGMLS